MMGKQLSDLDKILYENLNTVKYNIEKAAKKSNRDFKDITLVCATKTVSATTINKAIEFGVKNVGENRVQELLQKYDEINKDDCRVHFIGHLQTNKVKDVVGKVDMIQSVDSFKLADLISKLSKEKGVTTNVMVEINIGKDPNKFGVLKEDLEDIIYKMSKLSNVNVKGFMAVLPVEKEPGKPEFYFNEMRNLFIDMDSKKIDNISMEYLSMGMSGDYAKAIECGANMVRLGSCVFGNRN